MMHLAPLLLAATLTAPAPGVGERALTLTVDGERIPAALDLPDRSPAKGAVLIVPGAFNSDVDGNYPNQSFYPHTYADIARGLAACGYATLRYAKDGEGSGTTIDDAAAGERHHTFAERIVVARAALQALHEVSGDAPLAVAGHSEGGLVATLLAAQDPNVRALIELEAPGRPILDLVQRQALAAIDGSEQTGAVSPQAAIVEKGLFAQVIAGVRLGVNPPPNVLGDPLIARYFGKPIGVELAYLREEDRIDPARAIAGVRQPVLIVEGAADNVVPAEDAMHLNLARVSLRLPTMLKMLPGDQHYYKRVPPETTPLATMHLEGETDPAVVQTLAEWLSATVSAAAPR
ncbi:alpha/beta hydrolase [bacterium]|nr:MAG: alpha/beta hydrolase [bacterium]